MSLIEKLGGYERAKHEFKMIEEMTPKFPDEVKTNNRLLLEYRREHNIFEVGDCVVKTDPKIKHAHVRVVISTSPSGGAVLDYQGFPYKFPCVRHATDEEIKAGRRLSKIKCWSCDKEMSHSDRAENDGFCIHCNAEIEL